jgi:hypothetical protein
MTKDITFLLLDEDVERLVGIMSALPIKTKNDALRIACRTYDQCAKITMGGEQLLTRKSNGDREPLAFPDLFAQDVLSSTEEERKHAFIVKRMNEKRLEELRLHALLATRNEFMSVMIRFLHYVAQLHRANRPLFRESDLYVERVIFKLAP